MQKIKLFANYSIPVIWGIVGLVAGCVASYLFLGAIWTHVFVKPENATSTDFYTVVILALITGVFVGAAALFNSAMNRWIPHTRMNPPVAR
jgi:H+/Cl- antiporter ClcA